MRYTLCIEGDSGKINITDPNVIKKISIKISQSDESSNDRSEQMSGDLVIQGVLNDKSQQETKELFDWSMQTKKANVYKTVSIQVYDGDELIRDYYLKQMYCTSYEEVFDSYTPTGDQKKESIGSFVLVMKQLKGAIETIVVSCE